MYDLLLKNARVLDPGSGHDATGDVAFAEGRVAALAENIADSESRQVRDVTGLIVTPGLIDLHTHVYWGGTSIGIDPDDYALPVSYTHLRAHET